MDDGSNSSLALHMICEALDECIKECKDPDCKEDEIDTLKNDCIYNHKPLTGVKNVCKCNMCKIYSNGYPRDTCVLGNFVVIHRHNMIDNGKLCICSLKRYRETIRYLVNQLIKIVKDNEIKYYYPLNFISICAHDILSIYWFDKIKERQKITGKYKEQFMVVRFLSEPKDTCELKIKVDGELEDVEIVTDEFIIWIISSIIRNVQEDKYYVIQYLQGGSRTSYRNLDDQYGIFNGITKHEDIVSNMYMYMVYGNKLKLNFTDIKTGETISNTMYNNNSAIITPLLNDEYYHWFSNDNDYHNGTFIICEYNINGIQYKSILDPKFNDKSIDITEFDHEKIYTLSI